MPRGRSGVAPGVEEATHRDARPATPRISVVVPVYNAVMHLRRCLDSILVAVEDYGQAEVIVVDNGSTDGSWELVQRRYAGRVKALRQLDGHVGKVRNVGAARAEGEILSFVDADCEVGREYLHRIVQALDDTHAQATGSRYALPPSPHWVERVWAQLHRRRHDGPADYISAGNFCVLRRAFEDVGGFREDLDSGEDAELGLRMRRRGFRIHESSSVLAVHHGNPKTLRAFFRKHVWHGMGMFGTTRGGGIDKPVVMTILQLGLLLLAAAWTLVGIGTLPVRLATSLALTFVVPIATVVYRVARGGLAHDPIRAFVLYWVYYAARLVSLARIIASRGRLGRRAMS